jgi:hypothetical protein
VGSVSAYIRSDDLAVLDTMLGDRSLAALQLRRIAPTVVVFGRTRSCPGNVARERFCAGRRDD